MQMPAEFIHYEHYDSNSVSPTVIYSYQVDFCRAACVGDDSSAHCEVSVVRTRPPVSSKVLAHAAHDVFSFTLRQVKRRHAVAGWSSTFSRDDLVPIGVGVVY